MKRFFRKWMIYFLTVVLTSAGSILMMEDVRAAEMDAWNAGAASLRGKQNVKLKKNAKYSYNSCSSFTDASTYEMEYNNNAGVAAGGTIYLEYGSAYLENVRYEWTSDDNCIQIEGNGSRAIVRGKYTGTAKITVKVTGTDWSGDDSVTESKTIDVQVTNPRLKASRIGLVIYNWGQIQTVGVSSAGVSRIWYDGGNSDNFYVFSDGSFYGMAKQKRDVKVYADGKYLGAVEIKITNPTWNIGYYMVKKGKTKSFAVKGASGYTPVTYKIGNTKYATVSKAGKVKGKKYGKTSLSVRVDGASGKIDLYVVKSKVYTAVNKAHSICKSRPKYSQAKRMKKGYVDCSSFVWKSYKSAKVYLGSKTYAPTAANMAKWCSKKKKLLKFSSYNGKSGKLKPGDLIFYKKRSGKNGRYKNIDHVAMYVGNDTIVHADGSSVSYSSPWYRKAAAIARPVK